MLEGKVIQKEGFGNAASIHSISETASRGGKIGWIDKNSLNKSLANKLTKLNIGDYTDPILTPSGYLIVKLENKKNNEVSEEDIEKKIDEILPKLTIEQKVGQVIQGDSDHVSPEDVKKYRLGSVLSLSLIHI